MLDQPYMTDLIEANSMGHKPNSIDIYSASWGPTDDGKTVDGPRNATMRAIVRGVNEGRHGLGSIYVWASGDGGPDDDCNCDGYAASMWTISINSATNDGMTAGYDESCSSTLASTFSNGKSGYQDAGVVSCLEIPHFTVVLEVFECLCFVVRPRQTCTESARLVTPELRLRHRKQLACTRSPSKPSTYMYMCIYRILTQLDYPGISDVFA